MSVGLRRFPSMCCFQLLKGTSSKGTSSLGFFSSSSSLLRTSLGNISKARPSILSPFCRNAREIHCSSLYRVKEINKEKQPVEIGGGNWQEIYEGILATQVKLIKSFSLGTTLIGISLQPIVINYLGSSLGLVMSFSALIGMFTFVTPALIHWFTRKYVFTLKYDAKTDLYAATTLSFFLREKTLHFALSDVRVPPVPPMFTTFYVHNKPLFVDMEAFKDVHHFGRLMGYDKYSNAEDQYRNNKL